MSPFFFHCCALPLISHLAERGPVEIWLCSLCMYGSWCRTPRSICRSWMSFVSLNSTTSATASTSSYRDMIVLLDTLSSVVCVDQNFNFKMSSHVISSFWYLTYYCNVVGWRWWDSSPILRNLSAVLWYCWLGLLTR